jgi:hypothetical protein
MRMDAEHLLAEAERRCGLDDWGGEAYFEGAFRALFGALVMSMRDEADLNERGWRAADLRLRGMLDARLSMIEERKQVPEIEDEQIVRPIFVLGLPRSGSSFLQALLAQDPDNIAPTTAQFFFPAPLHGTARDGEDASKALTHEIQKSLGMFDPGIQALHPWSDAQPEECHFAMELLGWSEQLAASWRVPTYNLLRVRYLREAFATHRMVLQHLQHRRGGGRFTLKSPGHLLRLKELLAAYPDALIVQTHRDPARVMPSLTAFLVALRKIGSDSLVPGDKLARANLRAFSEVLMKVIEFRGRSEAGQQFHDVLFTDIVRDPIGSVRSIYERFGLKLQGLAVEAMQAWLHNPANDTPRGSYTLDEYGMDERMIEEHFGRYLDHYAIPRERSGHRRAIDPDQLA